MQGKIALGGGGSAEDSRLLDAVFAKWVGTQGKMLYLPLAMRGLPLAMRGLAEFDSCLAWITNTFAPFNITNITMWRDLSLHSKTELNEFDAVYIGGGNTYSLLAQFLENDFVSCFCEYVHDGGIVYGGSAGAVVLGKDLRTVTHIDTNSIGLKETACLNLVQDHAVWVHYTEQDDPRIEQFYQEANCPVIAVSERTGVIIEGGKMQTVGYETAYRFDLDGKQPILEKNM